MMFVEGLWSRKLMWRLHVADALMVRVQVKPRRVVVAPSTQSVSRPSLNSRTRLGNITITLLHPLIKHESLNYFNRNIAKMLLDEDPATVSPEVLSPRPATYRTSSSITPSETSTSNPTNSPSHASMNPSPLSNRRAISEYEKRKAH